MFSVRAASSAVTEPKIFFIMWKLSDSVCVIPHLFIFMCLSKYLYVCVWVRKWFPAEERQKNPQPNKQNKKNNQMSSDGKHFLRERIAVIFSPSRTILIQFL